VSRIWIGLVDDMECRAKFIWSVGFRGRTGDERPGWILWWCCRVGRGCGESFTSHAVTGVTTAVPIGVIHKTIDADHPSRLHATMVAYGITYNCEQ